MKKILLICTLFAFVMNFFAVTHTVNSGSFYYSPSMLTVNANDTVVWVNDGGYHNVNFDISTITGMSFNNPVSFSSLPTNGTSIYSYVFTVPGNYIYDCSVGSHAANGMAGTIQVNAASNPLLGTWKLAQVPAALAVGPN
ncbi:MAG: cupredoxin domain-containing protein, partial [Methylophagaceae bacterium]